METRAVIRCSHCALNQFVSPRGICPRCRKPYFEEPAAVKVQPPEAPARKVPDWRTWLVNFGAAVRLLRVANGWSLRDFADRFGCSHPNVSAIENGRRQPKVNQIERWASALGVPASVLIALAEVYAARRAA